MNLDPTIVFGTITALFTLSAGAWALLKAYGFLMNKAVAQFELRLDERFAAMERARAEGRKVWEERLARLDAKQERIDAELRDLLIKLPDKFVRREDYVRRETVIEGKIDQLALRIENWILKDLQKRSAHGS